MTFNSLTFVCFFAILLGLYALPMSWRGKKVLLLLASYLFYAAWNPPFVLLLWFSTMVDWFVARALWKSDNPAIRRGLVCVSLAANLGLLGFFKYGGFVLENFAAAVNAMGVAYSPAAPDIVLPVGISFYTFQTLSYSLDVYRREYEPASSFLDYAMFVTFFPQLVAGPIVRPSVLVPQFAEAKRATGAQLAWGLGLLTLGLFQKVVLADGPFAFSSDLVFGAPENLSRLDAWTGVLAFTGQIFCDFAGYSTCAIGVALCLGFSIPDNFRSPYAAVGLRDFWRRWHISLSTWLRDYLYIPLGGNRRGRIRVHANLLMTMLIGGLWHGASWTFVVWGLLHGLYLVGERVLTRVFAGARWVQWRITRVALGTLTLALVAVGWVFFRAQDFPAAWRLLRALFVPAPDAIKLLATIDIQNVFMPLGFLLAAHCFFRERTLADVVTRLPWWVVAVVWALMGIAITLMQGVSGAFIYFQF